MGTVEGVIDSMIGENEGGKVETQSNFVDDGKCPTKSYPKLKSSQAREFSENRFVLMFTRQTNVRKEVLFYIDF